MEERLREEGATAIVEKLKAEGTLKDDDVDMEMAEEPKLVLTEGQTLRKKEPLGMLGACKPKLAEAKKLVKDLLKQLKDAETRREEARLAHRAIVAELQPLDTAEEAKRRREEAKISVEAAKAASENVGMGI